MKRKTLLILLLIVGINSHAETKFGITTGMQFTNVRIINYNTDNRFAFNAGLTTLMPVVDGIDFNAQLVVSGKGYLYYDSYGYKNIIRPLYLELPLTFRFNFQSSSDSKVFFGGGGYFAYGIGGNKIYYDNGYQATEKVTFGDTNNDDLVSSDLGLVFQLGAEFRENYQGTFFYDMGLKKIIPNTTSNSFNRVFGFNLSWFF